MSRRHVEYVVVKPAFVPKLERRFRPAANVAQEGVQPWHVFFEVRRQLEQYRPLPFFQHGRDADEVVGIRFSILQPPEMRDDLPSLEHEPK